MTPNTTARQAGLTDEQIADAIPLTAMIVYGAVSGDPKTVRMNLGELREFAANILAAHSADARNGDSGPLFCDFKTDEEKANFFLSGRGYETGVIARSIQNDVAMAYQRCANYAKELDARNGEGVALTPEDMEPMLVAANVPVEVWEEVMDFAAMLLAAPAAPAPTDLAPCIGQCGNAVLASGDRICHECREAAPAPAAPAPTQEREMVMRDVQSDVDHLGIGFYLTRNDDSLQYLPAHQVTVVRKSAAPAPAAQADKKVAFGSWFDRYHAEANDARQQSAAPAVPSDMGQDNIAEDCPHDTCNAAACKCVAIPTDAASEADKRESGDA